MRWTATTSRCFQRRDDDQRDGIHVDYAGSSPASPFGINVVMNYTLAYTAFGIKCVVAPEVPNNAGSLAPLTASAPEGCILNVKRPRAVAARHTVGHMLPDVVFGCLHQVMPGGVPAEGASSLWIPQIYGGADWSTRSREGPTPAHRRVLDRRSSIAAAPARGRARTGSTSPRFPSGVRTIPVEATESIAPVLFRRREFREGSGGAGKFRGGLGQVIEFGGIDGTPIALLCNFERINNPARGRDGGGKGEPGGSRCLRPPDPLEGPADRAARRLDPARAAGRRRLRRSPPRAAAQVAEDVLDGSRLARDGRARLRRRRRCGWQGRSRRDRPAAPAARRGVSATQTICRPSEPGNPIAGGDRDALSECLRNHHPIEWISDARRGNHVEAGADARDVIDRTENCWLVTIVSRSPVNSAFRTMP